MSHFICALTFFHLTTYNLQYLFCNALPSSMPTPEDLIDDIDIIKQMGIIQEQEVGEKKDAKISTFNDFSPEFLLIIYY